jgi:hypothetical protein
MTEKINKIIVIRDYPFNQLDYERFGIELLRNNGLKIEIWDITPCIHEKFKYQLVEEGPSNFKGLQIFKEKNEVVKAISSLDNGCIINCFIEYSLRTFFVFRAISKQQINYCVYEMVSFPNLFPIQNSYIERIASILKKSNSLKFKEIIQHILNKTLLKYFFLFGIAPASIVLLGGDKSTGSSLFPVDKTTTRLWTHSLDYDIYLQDKTELIDSCKKTGVFLDEYLPFHPDSYYMGIEFPISPENYYPKVCNFFNILEKNMNVRIVIAAHPKSDYENLPDYFHGRTLIKGETARLVRESSFVIVHASTSLDFAVLYNKPILFLTTEDIQKMNSGKNLKGLAITVIAAELGKKPINIDHLSGFNWEKEMVVNHEAYLRFKDHYIKKQGTPEKPMWEIFYSYIQQKNIS